MQNYLDFEKGLAELQGKAEELRAMARQDPNMDVSGEADQLDARAADMLKDLYKELTPWQKCLVARHPERPHAQDYIDAIFTEYTPLAGDRNFAEDHAIVGGLAAVTGSVAIGAVLTILFLVAIVYSMVKLSMTLPVVVIEGVFSPLAALKRSWQLTRGNSVRLALFYLLLFVAYMALAIVAGMILMGLLSVLSDLKTLNLVLAGVISGVIAAAASVLFAGVLASAHRQLAGNSPEAIGKTFE